MSTLRQSGVPSYGGTYPDEDIPTVYDTDEYQELDVKYDDLKAATKELIDLAVDLGAELTITSEGVKFLLDNSEKTRRILASAREFSE